MGGGEIEEIGVRLATKLGEKGIKSEINLKQTKGRHAEQRFSFSTECVPLFGCGNTGSHRSIIPSSTLP